MLKPRVTPHLYSVCIYLNQARLVFMTTSEMPAFQRPRQNNQEAETSPGYIVIQL